MSFHPEKCEVIHVTTKKTPILHSYNSLHGHNLSSVPQIKYIGVHISQYLKWNSHINSTSSKANQTLGFLKRNLRNSSNTVKENAYKWLVHPKLEYCSAVWNPKCVNNPNDGDKTSHRVEDRPTNNIWFRGGQQVGWPEGITIHEVYQTCCDVWTGDPLVQRRMDSKLSMLYKTETTLRLIEPLNYFEIHYWRFRQTYFFFFFLTITYC